MVCFSLAAFCGQPPLVLHTKMFGRRQLKYRANSQVRYYCEPGFIQRQNPIITCQSNGTVGGTYDHLFTRWKIVFLLIYIILLSHWIQMAYSVNFMYFAHSGISVLKWRTGNLAHRSEQGNNYRGDNNKNNNTWICGHKMELLKQAYCILSLSSLSCHPFVYPP